jgi:hypothetical protein
MSFTEIVVSGTLQPDGTLVLDQKPNLPAGRVTIVLRQEVASAIPSDDPFWQRMQALWAIPKGSDDGGANTCAEVLKLREEWEERQQAIEQVQEECRLTRKTPG